MTDEATQDIEPVEGNEVVADDVKVTEAPENAPPEWSEDEAEEAKFFGWKPPEEWQGEKPAGYIDDPRRFMERAQQFTPFKKLTERQEKLEADFAERTRKLEAVAAKQLEAQKAQYDAEMERIQAAQRKAVEVADVDTYEALERRKNGMVVPEAPQPGQDPYVMEYAAKNEWVNNPILRKAGAEIIDAHPAMRQADAKTQLEYAESEVKKLYPGAFPQAEPAPKTPRTARVDAGGLAGGSAKGDGFTKLPAEAKSAFKNFVQKGIFKDNDADRKRYTDDYNAA